MQSTNYVETDFRSRDAGEAELWLASHYGRVRLGSRFDGYAEDMVGDERFRLASTRMLGSFSCAVVPEVVFVSTGGAGSEWTVGDESGSFADEPALFQPQQTSIHRVADTEGRAVVFSVGDLRRTARLLYARDDLELRFDGPRPVDRGRAASWLGALEVAREERRLSLLDNDLMRATTYRLLAVAVLESFRIIGDRRALHTSAERRARVFRLGAQYLRDYAAMPITIDDAAVAAGASTAELLMAFRSHAIGGLGPTAYLRRSRLSSARDELADTDATVLAVSTRWGYSSEAAFVRHYRSEYGANPVSSAS
jgi:AraC-like DNA-binding protein